MIKTTYQTPELRDANDNIVQNGAFGKNTALSNATNDGWIDYVMNDLEALHDVVGESSPTLDGNGHVVQPANLAIGDEDGLSIKNGYLKKSGGTMTGTLNVAQNLKMQDNQENVWGGFYVPPTTASSQYLQLYGGESQSSNGGNLQLLSNGQFTLQSKNGTTAYNLVGGTDGTLKWRGNNVAVLSSPSFTGNPTAPTQATNNNSTRLANTEFVNNYANANLLRLSGYQNIPDNSDLDDYKTVGVYRCSAGTVAATLANCPYTTSGFILRVFNGGNENYKYQELISTNSPLEHYVRVYNSTTTVWSTWKHFAFAENVLPLSGGTLTGNLTQQGTGLSITQKDTSIERGVNPSSAYSYWVVRKVDKNDKNVGGIYKTVNTSGSSNTSLYDYPQNSASAAGHAIHMGHSANGDPFCMPSHDNLLILGTSSNRWKKVYAVDGEFSGDITVKNGRRVANQISLSIEAANTKGTFKVGGANGCYFALIIAFSCNGSRSMNRTFFVNGYGAGGTARTKYWLFPTDDGTGGYTPNVVDNSVEFTVSSTQSSPVCADVTILAEHGGNGVTLIFTPASS